MRFVKQQLAGKVVPMMCGSAFKNKGVQAMLGYGDGNPSFSYGYRSYCWN